MKQRIFQCVGIHEAEALLQRKDLLIFDVRDAGSFQRSRIKGAQHVTISNLFPIVSSTNPKTPILIYCYHGHASKEYAQVFADFRFAEVYSLNGGYEAWSAWLRAGSKPPSRKLQQWLAKSGFPQDGIDARLANGTTPLMQASHDGETDIIRSLIAAGAELDARNDDGNHALWFACVGRHLDVIDMLVEAGIDIDNRNDNGATSLMYAASSGNAAVAERLLERGADTRPETLDGFTALDLASTLECLTLLRRATGTARHPKAEKRDLQMSDS